MDIAASNWNEVDASNSTAAPDGAPEGMAPSGVNDVLRAHQGAVKRWYNWTVPTVTDGTSTAYTLTYGVAPGALVDGMTHMVRFNAANGAAATLNVNGLGALPLYSFQAGTWAQVAAGAIEPNAISRVAYNAVAGAYLLLDVGEATAFALVKTVAAGSALDFPNLPPVNHLALHWDVVFGTNNVNLYMQFYNSSGVLDTGAHYVTTLVAVDSAATVAGAAYAGASAILLGTAVANNADIGCAGKADILDIQATKYTQGTFSSSWLDQAGTLFESAGGGFTREAAGPIQGLKLTPSGGTFTGRATLVGRV